MATRPAGHDARLHALRRALAVTRTAHFLDYAATAPIPDATADTIAEVARMGTLPMAERLVPWLGRVEDARRAVADVVGALPHILGIQAGKHFLQGPNLKRHGILGGEVVLLDAVGYLLGEEGVVQES